MLVDSERAYSQALLALKNKDYQTAVMKFAKASGDYRTNEEFDLLYQTTQLLLAVKQELALEARDIEIAGKELLTNG